MTKYEGVSVSLGTRFFARTLAMVETILGRGPDFISGEEKAEWEVSPNSWIIISKAEVPYTRVRFGTMDIASASARVTRAGLVTSGVRSFEDKVEWIDFSDGEEHLLGLFRNIAGEN